MTVGCYTQSHIIQRSAIVARRSRTDGLTNREVEILRRVTSGLTNRQLAEELGISTRTIDAHLRSVYAKLGVKSRSAATRYAIEHHLV
ncbi:MAG: response regulator transcription factor [Chloroflexi bacterium]|nr:MAG: response regulator transcription factor [Chloroflexota bacterium]